MLASLCHFTGLWVCIVWLNEFLLPEIQPATAQITNPTNMAKHQCVFFSFISGCRRYDSGFIHCTSPVEQTWAIWNATLPSKQPIPDKAWKDIAFLFFLCFTASFFLLPIVTRGFFANRNKTMRGCGLRGWDCTAVHDAHDTLLWNEFTHLLKRTDTVAVLVLQEQE